MRIKNFNPEPLEIAPSGVEVYVKLSMDKAINFLEELYASGEIYVKCNSGVWNDPEIQYISDVIRQVRRSGYGADIYKRPSDSYYIVSIPSNGDMF